MLVQELVVQEQESQDLRGELAELTDDIKDKVLALIEEKARALVAGQAARFWSEWYPAHRMDMLIPMPGPIPDLRVHDARKAFELVFGAPPAK